ncbi:methyltransferase type 12 [Mangrovactinospora gilvigrisea]|uniref:Methyltransferase type 12 n=1 Tax=Mangrovactinospora gilvigrisea TaxID=1428644 RepID=A0A1J7C8W5_9ACTN|nr:methyltransferase domain-containing protein [Mangrovactinospora gilvigrisea]OIV36058.1 methyltransferase type 12 [Mangrovactinospora gilvigrisea]
MTATPDPADWRELNRAHWDASTPVHVASDFYDLAGFRAGADPFAVRPWEPEELGPVDGRSLVHLQCHIGTDTLGWARRGARVTGVDLSPESVKAARKLAADIGAEGARFVESDVYAAPEALHGERFDIVYTGVGALVWLPDMAEWARVVARLLKPGGVFYISEFHPMKDVVAEDGRTLEGDYFGREPMVCTGGWTYTDGPALAEETTGVEFVHPLGDVVTALAAAGLRIELLRERDTTMFRRYPALVRGEDGLYRFPEDGAYAHLPLMYSLRATAPPARASETA